MTQTLRSNPHELSGRHDPAAASDGVVREALDRTMRLMRDDLRPEITNERLVAALRAPRVNLVADAENLASASGQTALVATALLLLRSGTTVHLEMPDVALLGSQAPLAGSRLREALLDASANLIPGVVCDLEPIAAADVAICIGDSPWSGDAALHIRISGTALTTTVTTSPHPSHVGRRWVPATDVPFGALMGAGAAAAEVHKQLMQTLRPFAAAPAFFDDIFAPSPVVELTLDPAGEFSPEMLRRLSSLGDLGTIDAISGGAIIQAALFTLTRMPVVRGQIRVIEPEVADASNLNRYALLLGSGLGLPKADSLATMDLGGLTITPVIGRFDQSSPQVLGGLADAVLVGVDHIPTRWAVQRAHPRWLGVGATSHYAAMSSDHVRGLPCARCLHPTDAPDIGPIPTIAFVSHWAGLLLAWRFVRQRLGMPTSVAAQYDYFTPLRADLPAAFWRSPVAARPDCPNRCTPRRAVA